MIDYNNILLKSVFYRVSKILYKTRAIGWSKLKVGDVIYFKFIPYKDYDKILVTIVKNNDEYATFSQRLSQLPKFLRYFELERLL